MDYESSNPVFICAKTKTDMNHPNHIQESLESDHLWQTLWGETPRTSSGNASFGTVKESTNYSWLDLEEEAPLFEGRLSSCQRISSLR